MLPGQAALLGPLEGGERLLDALARRRAVPGGEGVLRPLKFAEALGQDREGLLALLLQGIAGSARGGGDGRDLPLGRRLVGPGARRGSRLGA